MTLVSPFFLFVFFFFGESIQLVRPPATILSHVSVFVLPFIQKAEDEQLIKSPFIMDTEGKVF